MPPSLTPDESFLPRIHAVFYAVFDPSKGPKVVYQVPEGLIGSRYPEPPTRTGTGTAAGSAGVSPTTPAGFNPLPTSSLTPEAAPTPEQPPRRRTAAPLQPLFDFSSISEHIIPKSPLCNRLVICTTPLYKIAGFPVLLHGARYPRNEWRFNLAFVFGRGADLGCYEPVVRKVGRVLTECEQDTSFLSSPLTSARIYPLLEQLFEDLNSYSESSIPLTPHTTLDLKIFPFYPNPLTVRDWDVPVALVDLRGKMDGSADLTMGRVVGWVDGVRCVGGIAEEADVDLDWVRGCVEHLLYYQHIMLLDLFAPSNIYTPTRSFTHLASDPIVIAECPLYVSPPTRPPLPWHVLLQLYNKLSPGKTLAQWAEECGVGDEVQLDVRRFVTFGVIKGFLRRVERYPVYLPAPGAPSSTSEEHTPANARSRTPTPSHNRRPREREGRERTVSGQSEKSQVSFTAMGRRPGGGMGVQGPGQGKSNLTRQLLARPYSGSHSRTNSIGAPAGAAVAGVGGVHGRARQDSPGSGGSTPPHSLPPGMSATNGHPSPANGTPSSAPTAVAASAPAAGAVAGPAGGVGGGAGGSEVPSELVQMLDGVHSGDELCWTFGVGWEEMEGWLARVGGVGGGEAEEGVRGDLGRVRIIFR